jgi:exodeoxyribonuclease V gamma subunit
VQRRFGLDEDDLARIRRWVAETGICWGWDEVHRAEFSVPPVASHTWRAGLERMLLGYAMPAGDRLFGGVLPYEEIEGSAARILSGLLDYLDVLQAWRKRLQAELTVGEWALELNGLLGDLFEPEPEEEAELQSVRDAMAAIARDAAIAQVQCRIGVDVLAAELQRRLQEESARSTSLRGGVCVAEWTAARALPFEVICVLGLDDGVFPRPDRRVDFDRMAGQRRRGDRSRRDDDRYLFLETLLSARRCLYLSYVGNDIRTGLPLPPSVLVSELLDLLERDFAPASHGALREQIVTRHPLQAFSPRYFNGDDRLFSYRRELAVAAPSMAAGRRPMFATRLPGPGAEWAVVPIEDVVRFYRQPVRFLLERRLGVRLAEYSDDLEASEPFALSRFAATDITKRLTETLLAGAGIDDAYPVELARGALPPGQVGRILLREAAASARELAATVRAQSPDAALAGPVAVDIALDGARITGTLQGVGAAGLFEYAAIDEIFAAQRLEFWIRHLLLAVGAPGRAGASTLCTLGGTIRINPVSDAKRQLQKLLDHFLEGLCEPLHFFPRSAFAYVEAHLRNKDALTAARAVWEGNEHKSGECEDAYYRLAFGEADPLDAAFERLTGDLVAPLYAHAREDE